MRVPLIYVYEKDRSKLDKIFIYNMSMWSKTNEIHMNFEELLKHLKNSSNPYFEIFVNHDWKFPRNTYDLMTWEEFRTVMNKKFPYKHKFYMRHITQDEQRIEDKFLA